MDEREGGRRELRLDGAAGFAPWFTDHYPDARSVALRILGSMAEAEDAAAEAFTRALVDWRKVAALPHRDAWVMRVTANVAIDAARRRRPLPVSAAADGQEAELATLRVALVAALVQLPARQRQAVVLRHLVGLPEADVAAAMGLSGNTVKKHLQRGLAKLRAIVPREDGADLAFP